MKLLNGKELLTLSTLCPYPLWARRYGRLNEARILYVDTFLMLMNERKRIIYILSGVIYSSPSQDGGVLNVTLGLCVPDCFKKISYPYQLCIIRL